MGIRRLVLRVLQEKPIDATNPILPWRAPLGENGMCFEFHKKCPTMSHHHNHHRVHSPHNTVCAWVQDCLALGAIFSATDSVATLQVRMAASAMQ